MVTSCLLSIHVWTVATITGPGLTGQEVTHGNVGYNLKK